MKLSIDLAILLLFVVTTIIHYRLGFIKSLYNIISLILGTILTKILQPVVREIISSGSIFNKITSYFTNILDLENTLKPIVDNASQNLIDYLNLPSFISNFMLNNENFNITESIDFAQLEQTISIYIANIIVNILSFVLTFLLICLILRILLTFFNFTFNLPIINNINKILGAIWGILKSAFIVWSIFIVIMFLTLNPNYMYIKEWIDNSKIASVLYENNYLLLLILKYFSSLI